jgi:hypothetical protein
MGFSLPLGSIPGYNANLGNKAGIQALDQPSPAGLGFGYEPGSITRKVVFVPDDNLGTRRNYTEDLTDDHCDLGWFT